MNSIKLFRFLIFLFSSFVFANYSFAQNNFNMTLLGNKTYNNQTLAGTWGYVKNNIEYALVGTNTGTSIVDITNPSALVEVAFVPGATSLWHEIRTFGDYAYITSEGGLGLQIINLSNLPLSAPSKFYVGNGVVDSLLDRFHSLHIDNGFAYLYGGNFQQGGVVIVDLADPWNPNYVGKWENEYIHDGFVQDNKIWACKIYAGEFSVIDVTNKANPVLLATQQTPNQFTHSNWLSTDKNYMFVADEVDGESLTSYDVSDLNNIKQLDRYTANFEPNALPHNVYLINDSVRTGSNRDFLVVAHNGAGVTILDVSQPEKMVEIAYYDTQPQDITYGIWGAYPYFPSGRIVGGDSNLGLCVFQPTYQKASFLKGIVTDLVTNATLNGVTIEILSTNIIETTNLNGKYLHGSRLNGLYDIKFSKAGYASKIIKNYQIGPVQVGVLNVSLTNAVLVNASGLVKDLITQNPVADAEVSVSGINGIFEVKSDAGGIFQFNQIPQDSYELYAGKFGFKTFVNPNQVISNGATISVELQRGIEDFFELDYNWTVSGDATAGAWERGVPSATFDQNGKIFSPEADAVDIGTQCFVTGNGPIGSGIDDFDVDGGTTILTSPVFDLTGIIEPVVNYSRWVVGSQNDTIKVFLTNGITTVSIDQARGNIGQFGVWLNKSIRVAQFLPATANMQLRVEVSDKKTDGTMEAAFDNFFITGQSTGFVQNGINEFGSISIFPNPVINNLNINYSVNDKNSEQLKLSVFNSIGQLVYERKLMTNSDQININLELPSGLYLAKIVDQKGGIMTQKFIKK